MNVSKLCIVYEEYISNSEFQTSNYMCLVVITYLIVGRFERSQLTPQQVRLYVNEVNNKRKDLLQKYIKMSNEANVLT